MSDDSADEPGGQRPEIALAIQRGTRKDLTHRGLAPGGARWSRWVKPVLFAHITDETPSRLGDLPAWIEAEMIEPLAQDAQAAAREPHPYRRAEGLDDVAVVADLPGADAVRVGVALAQHGFQPVPLYNAIPGEYAVVDQQPILEALVAAAERVEPLPPDAPPAFLLDSNRAKVGRPITGGVLDNRWSCFVTDFPSAETLWEAGIRRAVLVQWGRRPAVDLAFALRTWQERGIRLFLVRPNAPAPFVPCEITRPSWIARLFHRLRLWWSYHRHPSGAFGVRIPMPTDWGGGSGG